MKKKDLENIKSKTITELEKIISDKRSETSMFYANIKAGKEKNVSKIDVLRKEIAQILTIIREKQIAGKEEK